MLAATVRGVGTYCHPFLVPWREFVGAAIHLSGSNGRKVPFVTSSRRARWGNVSYRRFAPISEGTLRADSVIEKDKLNAPFVRSADLAERVDLAGAAKGRFGEAARHYVLNCNSGPLT